MLKITSHPTPQPPTQDLAKYRGANHIGSKSKTSEARERKKQRKKSKNRRLHASNNRRKRACIIFRSLGGEPDELCYEPHIYGIQQIDSVDEETLLLFISKTDKACLRDLFLPPCQQGLSVPTIFFSCQCRSMFFEYARVHTYYCI